jgi:hypothetical protein
MSERNLVRQHPGIEPDLAAGEDVLSDPVMKALCPKFPRLAPIALRSLLALKLSRMWRFVSRFQIREKTAEPPIIWRKTVVTGMAGTMLPPLVPFFTRFSRFYARPVRHRLHRAPKSNPRNLCQRRIALAHRLPLAGPPPEHFASHLTDGKDF